MGRLATVAVILALAIVATATAAYTLSGFLAERERGRLVEEHAERQQPPVGVNAAGQDESKIPAEALSPEQRECMMAHYEALPPEQRGAEEQRVTAEAQRLGIERSKVIGC